MEPPSPPLHRCHSPPPHSPSATDSSAATQSPSQPPPSPSPLATDASRIGASVRTSSLAVETVVTTEPSPTAAYFPCRTLCASALNPATHSPSVPHRTRPLSIHSFPDSPWLASHIPQLIVTCG